jgi:putative tryptophan/tyrosine transport system substrate-binding protein
MRRREFIAGIGGAAALPFAARGETQKKVYRVGFLETTSQALNVPNLDAFRKAMRELGYREGTNLTIDYRSAEGHTERFPTLAAELVRLKDDVIVPRGTPAALAAADATTTIPIVITAIAEPLGSGLVASLARPGRNVTGFSSYVTDLDAKRVEILKELVPGMVRLAALLNPQNPNHAAEWLEIEKAARTLRVEPMQTIARTSAEIDAAFERAVAQRANAIIVGLDTLTQTNRDQIIALAARHRLPAMYSARESVDAGGLIVYGTNYPDLYRRTAAYVDKILKGAKAAELPVQQPTKFELVINLKTAKLLGLTVPPTLLARADEVIE